MSAFSQSGLSRSGLRTWQKPDDDPIAPLDTNSWHTDLTFKAEQPFASILVARRIPPTGGDTLWSSCYAAFDRLPEGMKCDLEGIEAIHDMGDFRNSFADAAGGGSGAERLNDSVARFGHSIRPLMGQHSVTGRKYLNFNEAFVTHIVGMPTNESNALKTYLANHMNKPEDQLPWRCATTTQFLNRVRDTVFTGHVDRQSW